MFIKTGDIVIILKYDIKKLTKQWTIDNRQFKYLTLIHLQMKISLLPFVLCLIIMVSPQISIAFSQKITEFENKDYDVKIGYPHSWNIREGDIEPGDFNTQIAIFLQF